MTTLPATSRAEAIAVPVSAGSDFEANNLCGYQQDHRDNSDWTRKAVLTRSANTGPSTDRTTRISTGRTRFTHHLSPNRRGRWGITDDFTTSFLHFSPSVLHCPQGLGELQACPFLMLSSHLFFCLLCLLYPVLVPLKMVLARPDESETCPYHFSFRLFTMVRRSSCGLTACWILAQTSSLVTWCLHEMRCYDW